MISQAELRALLDYDQSTGVFRWRVTLGSRAVAGNSTGCVNKRKAVVIRLQGRLYAAHRLAWLHTYGEWPPHEIDHRNGDSTDNRLANLRSATRVQNTRNVRCHHDTASGIKGVYLSKGRWTSRICASGKSVHLGTFNLASEASAAYRQAAIQLHGDFARTE